MTATDIPQRQHRSETATTQSCQQHAANPAALRCHSYIRLATQEAQAFPKAAPERHQLFCSAVMAAVCPAVSGVAETVMPMRSKSMVFITATLTTRETDKQLKAIIREMASRAQHRIANPLAGRIVGVCFGLDFSGFPADGPDLWEIEDVVSFAERMWQLGWEGFLFLPRAWGVKCVWELMGSKFLHEALKNIMVESATILTHIKDKGARQAQMSEYLERERMLNVFRLFNISFPEFRSPGPAGA